MPGVRMRGPSCVTATVNSKWAANESSCGVDGPAVRSPIRTSGPAGVHHRLDRQDHALLQARALARIPEVRDLRVLVHVRGRSRGRPRLRMIESPSRSTRRLDRVRDVAQVVAGLRLLAMPSKSASRVVTSSSGSAWSGVIADRHRDRGVGHPAVVGHTRRRSRGRRRGAARRGRESRGPPSSSATCRSSPGKPR